MRDLNIDFMDLYKGVDKFIRDAYSSAEGVSEYILMMEKNMYSGRRYVYSWDDDYSKLKHLRWIRNQLSHEVGYDSDICEESDYDWLDDFRRRLFSSYDPLAAMNKAIKAERQRLEEQRRQSRRIQQKTQNTGSTVSPQKENNIKETPQRESLWQRIKRFFTGE